MVSQRTSLNQVGLLASFLTGKPDLPDLLRYLSLNISPIGDICAVTFNISDNDESRKVSTDQIIYTYDIDESDQFKSRTLRATCAIPLGVNLSIALDFENLEYSENHNDPFLNFKNFEPYFECIQAILKFYLAFQTKKFLNELFPSKKLSPRQLLIHKMMVTGKTNRQIASDLSYSVSLIRQETMSIYLKLGIDGRKEIRRDNKRNFSDLPNEVTRNADKD